MTIGFWLSQATKQLVKQKISSARLDAELILSHTIKKGRTFLHAHPDLPLEDRQNEIADARLRLRLDRVPLAYIIGHKEFFGRSFKVTPSTLIPRPESEAMIQLLGDALKVSAKTPAQTLVDVGTGSGCLGITAKLNHPELDVTLLDTSNHALNVAKNNAEKLGAKLRILRSDLLKNYPGQIDFILANLPYVDPAWQLSPELEHEPEIALFASDSGLGLIKNLLNEAVTKLGDGGWMFLEADLRQHADITAFAKARGYKLAASDGLILALRR